MENSYFETKNKKDCNGCGICALMCPKQCITMEEDEEGFLYPVINEEKCIHCNKCRRVCSNQVKEEVRKQECYAIYNAEEMQRAKSTSGGIFPILAEWIIRKAWSSIWSSL